MIRNEKFTRWSNNMSNESLSYSTKDRDIAKLTNTELKVLGKNDYKPIRLSADRTKQLWVRTEFGEVVETRWKPTPLSYKI